MSDWPLADDVFCPLARPAVQRAAIWLSAAYCRRYILGVKNCTPVAGSGCGRRQKTLQYEVYPLSGLPARPLIKGDVMSDPHAAETILVVDDAPELLRNISEMLEESGYRVVTATDGVEALHVLQTGHVDLILTDIAMPNLNGYQLYEQVRRNPAWVRIPFIFLTGRSMGSDIRYGKELGVDDYLIKPAEIADLAAAVRGRLRRAQQLEQPLAARVSEQAELELGRLRINTVQHRVWLDDKPIELSAREFILLAYLARHAGQVVSARELIQATHELTTDDQEAGSLARPLIRSIRRKLGYATGELGCIENVRSIGYRLIPPR